jgi:hypothetical protein
MLVALGLRRECPEREHPDRHRQGEQDDRVAVEVGELDPDQDDARDADRGDDRDGRSSREAAKIEAPFGDRDRARHQQDAHDRRGSDGEQDARPARDPERVATGDDGMEDHHRDRRRQRELRHVEDELGRALPTHEEQSSSGTDELGAQELGGREQVQPEHEPDLAERDRVRLAPELDMDDVGLGEIEDERKCPPWDSGRNDRVAFEVAQDAAPESDGEREEAGVVEPDRLEPEAPQHRGCAPARRRDRHPCVCSILVPAPPARLT